MKHLCPIPGYTNKPYRTPSAVALHLATRDDLWVVPRNLKKQNTDKPCPHMYSNKQNEGILATARARHFRNAHRRRKPSESPKSTWSTQPKFPRPERGCELIKRMSASHLALQNALIHDRLTKPCGILRANGKACSMKFSSRQKQSVLDQVRATHLDKVDGARQQKERAAREKKRKLEDMLGDNDNSTDEQNTDGDEQNTDGDEQNEDGNTDEEDGVLTRLPLLTSKYTGVQRRSLPLKVIVSFRPSVLTNRRRVPGKNTKLWRENWMILPCHCGLTYDKL
ncbi:MAG: hypothetical protein Q9170_001269 [Blastenia crenularia]